MEYLTKYVNWTEPSLHLAMASILFNPLFWNTVARLEYRQGTLTKLAGGNSLYGCYGLAATIFSLGILRDAIYHRALVDQPTYPDLEYGEVKILAAVLFAVGNTLVLSSMWTLGLTGTYLGDYFGILMDSMVTGFPFNVSNNPMYQGSTLVFLATALWYASPAGLVLTALVRVAYTVALRYEDPFTAMIYAKREEMRAEKTE